MQAVQTEATFMQAPATSQQAVWKSCLGNNEFPIEEVLMWMPCTTFREDPEGVQHNHALGTLDEGMG